LKLSGKDEYKPGEWRFIFVFTISFQAGDGGLYLSLSLHFKQGMEVYIHLYHLISSGEWRFIFIFTTSFQVGNGGLYSSLPLHFKQVMEGYIHL
jgi:phage-related protein